MASKIIIRLTKAFAGEINIIPELVREFKLHCPEFH